MSSSAHSSPTKSSRGSAERVSADLYPYYEQIRLRHDFALVLSNVVGLEAVTSLCDDLYTIGFRADVEAQKNDEGELEQHVVLIALDSETKILEEAERQKLSRHLSTLPYEEQKKIEDRIEKEHEEKGIDKRVLYVESYTRVSRKNRAQLSREHVAADEQGRDIEDIFCIMTEADRVRLSYQILYRLKLADLQKVNSALSVDTYARIDKREGLLDFLKRHKLCTDITALHSRSRAVLQMLDVKRNATTEPASGIVTKALKNWFVPVDLIRAYYGDGIAIYYQFMNFFLKWIFIPACCGVFINTTNRLVFDDPGKSPLNALFSIGMSVWAALFSVNWNRSERSLRVLWDNLYQTDRGIEMIREEFVGTPKIDPITERVEPSFPTKQRVWKYIESFFICLPMFGVVLVFLLIAYNLTGVIKADGKYDDFVIPLLADLAKPDAILDPDSNVGTLVGIAQAICMMFLNGYFRDIATWCTDRENHKYQSTYDNSLIAKRFIFEFVDCFLPLIYFGWWDLNYKVLRQNIISIYISDELRRVATETLIPYLTQNQSKIAKQLNSIQQSIQRKQVENELAGQKDPVTVEEQREVEAKKKQIVILEELEELNRDEHEIFDDYLEMVTTFGYISMFSSVFSFGATCIFVFILIEARSDLFRLENSCRRPIPMKENSIGSWSIIIQLFCGLSIFSNIIITTFASDQIDHLFPWLAGLKDSSIESLTTVAILEHSLLALVFILRQIYDCDPEWVSVYLQRKAYKKDSQAVATKTK